jgi:phage terminase large subunit GpA-like protein
MDTGDPVEARHDIATAFARDDLRRFRIPCAACGRGTVGIEETAEADG